MNKYLRGILICGMMLAMSAVCFIGIIIADYNTRAVGYVNAKPAISIISDDASTVISIMNSDIIISEKTLSLLSFVFDVYKKTVPTEVKASSALIGIIEMIADQSAQ